MAPRDVQSAGSVGRGILVQLLHSIRVLCALDFHGLLTRPVRTVQIASPHRFTGTEVSGRPLKVVFERADTVRIGAEDAGFGARVSNLERTLLDAAARPDLVGGYFPLAEALSASASDPARLQDLAEKLSAGPALRRIGSLADRLELNRLAGKLRPLTLPDWDLYLDPEARELSGAFRDGSWRIRWPVDPREVAEEIAQ